MGTEVSAPALLEALMDAGKCNHWGPGKSLGSRGRQEAFLTQSCGAGDGTGAEPWWVPKGIVQADGSGRAFQAEGTAQQSQGEGLWGGRRGRTLGVWAVWPGVAQSGLKK